MRSRLLVRVAALALAAGGLLVIPISPASAHCTGHNPSVDRYSGGGIRLDNTPLRPAPHVGCTIFATVGDPSPNVFCARDVDAESNDWVYVEDSIGRAGWAMEIALDVFDGPRHVPGCANPGNTVLIEQNP